MDSRNTQGKTYSEDEKKKLLDELVAQDPDRQPVNLKMGCTGEYQQQVLALLLTDADLAARHLPDLEPDNWVTDYHRAIFRHLKDHWGRYAALPTRAFLETALTAEMADKDDALRLLYLGELHTVLEYFDRTAPPEQVDDYLTAFIRDTKSQIGLLRYIALVGAGKHDAATEVLEEIAALRARTGKAAWPDPLPLRTTDLPAFPVQSLDVAPAFRAMVESIAHHIQVPADLAATVGLAVLSVATQKRVRIEVRPGAYEQAVLWTLCGLPPGERKTPAVNRLKQPLKNWEAADQEAKLKAVSRARVERDHLKDRRAEVQKSLKTATPGNEQYDRCLDQLADIDLTLSRPEPVVPRLLVDDATPEAVVQFLQRQGHKAAVVTDESSFLEISLGRYSDNPNMELYLKAWSGDGMPIDRKGSETVILPEAFLTLGLCIQPGPLTDLARHGKANDKGFMQRFLACLPKSRMGDRQQVMEAFPEHVQHDWDALVARVLGGRQRVLTHSPAGWDRLRQIEAQYEPLLREHGPLRAISGWVGKAFPGQVLRLAAILHLASGDEADEVPVATLDAAHEVVRYYLEHALNIHDVLRDDSGMEAAEKILEVITTKKINDFKYSEMKTQVWKFRKDEDVLAHAYARLADAHVIRPARYTTDRKTGENRISRFQVNPKLVPAG